MDTLRSIQRLDGIEELKAEVEQKLDGKLPRENDQINEGGAHDSVAVIIDAIREVAQKHMLCPHKPFHEHENTMEGMRADFVLTRANDHQPGPFASLWYIEAKSKENLLREGTAQCVNRILQQYRMTKSQLEFGIALVTDLRSFYFLRVEFDTMKTDVEDVVLARACVEVSNRLTLSLALEGLIRLMCDPDCTHYGLPASQGLPGEVSAVYDKHELLGSGGFSDVWRVSTKEPEGDAYFACKVTRDPEKRDQLAREVAALNALVGVPRIPQLVRLIDRGSAVDTEREPVALITKPVGTSLMDRVRSLPDGADRESLALDVFESVADTLITAHSKGVVHGDVRPRNIIVVEEEEKHQYYLIDWGHSATKRGLPTEKCYTSAGYATDPKKGPPEEHEADIDFQQLALSCIEIAFSDGVGRLPWYDVQCDRSALDTVEKRTIWCGQRWNDLMEFANDQNVLKLAIRQLHENDKHVIHGTAEQSWKPLRFSEVDVVQKHLNELGFNILPQEPGDASVVRSLMAADGNREVDATVDEVQRSLTNALRSASVGEEHGSTKSEFITEDDWSLIAAYANVYSCVCRVFVLQSLSEGKGFPPQIPRTTVGTGHRVVDIYVNSRGHYDALASGAVTVQAAAGSSLGQTRRKRGRATAESGEDDAGNPSRKKPRNEEIGSD